MNTRRASVRGWGSAAGMVLTLALSPAGARADLRFSRPSVDLGELRIGARLSHQFEFVNEGPEAVEVTEARASCGCMTPRLSQRVYPPGEHGCLLLEVNTLTQPAGPVGWRVQVYYRTGTSPREATLEMTARLVSEIRVQPAALVVFTDSALAHDVTLTDLRPRPLAITGVHASSPQLHTQLAPDGHDAAGHVVRTIRVEVTADYPEGRHEETVRIDTDDPDYRELTVPVTVVKRPRQRLSLLPAEVTLVAGPGQPSVSRIVQVRDKNNEAVVVDRVEADDPAVACQWAQGPGAMATLKVRVERDKVRGPDLQTTVRVRVCKPEPQELILPVSCRLQ